MKGTVFSAAVSWEVRDATLTTMLPAGRTVPSACVLQRLCEHFPGTMELSPVRLRKLTGTWQGSSAGKAWSLTKYQIEAGWHKSMALHAVMRLVLKSSSERII